MLNCCALTVAACVGLQMRTGAGEENKVTVFYAQQI